MNIFSGIFTAIGAVFNWIIGRGNANNRPEIVTNREAIEEAKAKDTDNRAIAEAIKTGDVTELRKKESIK